MILSEFRFGIRLHRFFKLKRATLLNFKKPYVLLLTEVQICYSFDPRSHFLSRLSLIVKVNVIQNRTVVVESD